MKKHGVKPWDCGCELDEKYKINHKEKGEIIALCHTHGNDMYCSLKQAKHEPAALKLL